LIVELVNFQLHLFWLNTVFVFLPGTSLHLLEAVVSNGIADLKDVNENDMTIFGTNSSKVTTKSASKRYSNKRKHDQQMQNSVFAASEKASMSPRKKKSFSTPATSKEMASESITDGRTLTPLSVRIAALETLEILLNVVCFNLNYFASSYIFCKHPIFIFSFGEAHGKINYLN
jgi:hypothetical protein